MKLRERFYWDGIGRRKRSWMRCAKVFGKTFGDGG